MKNKYLAIMSILRGRPTAYNIHIKDGGIVIDRPGGTFVGVFIEGSVNTAFRLFDKETE
jgi:hypothetical protein